MNSNPSALKLGEIYKALKCALSDYGSDCPDIEARLIIERHTGLELSDIIALPEQEIGCSEYSKIMGDLGERLTGRPLSRLYGEREFWGLSFDLSPETLDPRPDTERLVEIVLERSGAEAPNRILDIGTGTGCILISLLSEFDESFGVGIDFSFGALCTARRNAAKHHVESRARFINGSWIESVADRSFDLIVSNPPYVTNQIIDSLSVEVRNHDPILALDGGDDGLQAYKILIPTIKSVLKPGGTCLLEIGYDQADDVMRLSEIAGFALRCVHVDYSGNPRVVEISCGDK